MLLFDKCPASSTYHTAAPAAARLALKAPQLRCRPGGAARLMSHERLLMSGNLRGTLSGPRKCRSLRERTAYATRKQLPEIRPTADQTDPRSVAPDQTTAEVSAITFWCRSSA
jgi:hypothetical protein